MGHLVCIVTFVIILTNSVEGFLVQNPEINHFLSDFARTNSQTGINLNIRLDILANISDDNSSHLFIRDLVVDLTNKELIDNHSNLPQISSTKSNIVRGGPRTIETHSDGHFVSVNGRQVVKLVRGKWELLWIENKPAGSIISTFNLEEDVYHNDAVLRAGAIHVTFPVYTKKGLKAMRLQQIQHEELLKFYTITETEEFKLVNETKNLLMKIVHFRRAVIANENFSKLKSVGFVEIPQGNEEFIIGGEDLMIYTKGSVWSKSEGKECIFVGQASIKTN